MKKHLILAMAILLAGSATKAQTSDPESDYIRKTYSKDKKTLVSDYMTLNMQDSLKFWPIYADYEVKRQKLASIRIDLITQYVNGYNSLTPDATDKLITASFDNNISLDELNSDYYQRMKKAVGAVNSAKYMQLEIYLQTMWKAIVQSNIPLIGAIDKTQHN
jgi:hypothetical protein